MNTAILSLTWLALLAPPVETAPAPSTRLYVRTIPPGAEVKLDGKAAGKSDRLFVVPPGVSKMTVEVELDEHYPEKQEVEVRGGRITRVELKLKKRDAAPAAADPKARVRDAVTTISTCAEGDPRVAAAIKTLDGLDQKAVAAELAAFLDEKRDAMRRAAIYVLWNGKLTSIEPAVPGLLKLCDHREDLTRGMAALALGSNKVEKSLPALVAMATKDASGYARRCAAYALGPLGDKKAIPALKEALRDQDPLVRNNAEAALTMLGVKAEEGGAQEPPAPTPDKTNLIESRVLAAEFSKLLADALAAEKKAGKPLPAGWDAAEFAPKMIEELKKKQPRLFLVLAEQERKFAAGEFDDAAAAKQLEATLKVLADFRVSLPWFHRHLIEQFRAGKLQGARLEMANRVLVAMIGDLIHKLDGNESATRGTGLDFRIAPTRGGEKPLLAEDEIKRYVEQLKAGGPGGPKPDGDFAWFALAPADDLSPNLVTETYKDRKYVLLSNQPDRIMLARNDRRGAWGLKGVSASKDPQDHPMVEVEFDKAGAERFAALTGAWLGRPLAILVGGQVLSVPTIQSKISHKAVITGRFSEEQVQQLVRSLTASMLQSGDPPPPASDSGRPRDPR